MIKTIFSQLVYNGEYFGRVWPYLKDEYFDNGPARDVFNLFKQHYKEYSTIPSVTALNVALDKERGNQVKYDGAKALLDSLVNTPEDLDWLTKETEKFVQDAAMANATSRIIEIQMNDQLPEKERDRRIPSKGAIPEIMAEALAIGFNTEVGHDWFNDWRNRFAIYMSRANKIPFNLEILNILTKGGVERGTLNVLLAGVNVGKSLGLCSLAADYMKSGYNVLYVSMEMAEHVCAKRIDANLLDISMSDIDDQKITIAEFEARMNRATKNGGKPLGKLVIKQYPTGSASVLHFDTLLRELKLKKNFVPDILIVDYLGICASSRLRTYSENSYTLVKAIAEELRGLAVKHNLVCWTAAQTTRAGWDASDLNMSDTAESAGLPATADLMWGVIETEELAKMGIQMIKQIKSRYADKNEIPRVNMGVRKGNQRWYETENSIPQQPQPPVGTVSQADRRAKLDEAAQKIHF